MLKTPAPHTYICPWCLKEVRTPVCRKCGRKPRPASDFDFKGPGRFLRVRIDRRYQVTKFIGAGGFGEVYQAYDATADAMVAAKFLVERKDGSKSRHAMAKSMFGTECETLARLDSPYIVDFVDRELAPDGTPVLIMELLRGRSLATLLFQERVLDPGMIAEVGVPVCRALQHAHDRGFIHRDLKPENVFIQDLENGGHAVKILDFGLVETAEHLAWRKSRKARGPLVGTCFYMSPEQCVLGTIGPWSDLFSFGVMLHEMATGRLPFNGMTPELVMDAIVHHRRLPPPVGRDLPSGLAGLIDDLLEPDPALRPSSALVVENRLIDACGLKAASSIGSARASRVAMDSWNAACFPAVPVMPSPIVPDSTPGSPGAGLPSGPDSSRFGHEDSRWEKTPSWMQGFTVRDLVPPAAMRLDRIMSRTRDFRNVLIVLALCVAGVIGASWLVPILSSPAVSDIRFDCAGKAMNDVEVSGTVLGSMFIPLTDLSAYKLGDGRSFMWVLTELPPPADGFPARIRARVIEEQAWERACNQDGAPVDCERIAGAMKMVGGCALLELER